MRLVEGITQPWGQDSGGPRSRLRPTAGPGSALGAVCQQCQQGRALVGGQRGQTREVRLNDGTLNHGFFFWCQAHDSTPLRGRVLGRAGASSSTGPAPFERTAAQSMWTCLAAQGIPTPEDWGSLREYAEVLVCQQCLPEAEVWCSMPTVEGRPPISNRRYRNHEFLQGVSQGGHPLTCENTTVWLLHVDVSGIASPGLSGVNLCLSSLPRGGHPLDRYLIHREMLNRLIISQGRATADVARGIGVTPATLRHLRNGTRATVGETTLMALAQILDVAPSYLGQRIDAVIKDEMRRTRTDSRDVDRVEVVIHHRRRAAS